MGIPKDDLNELGLDPNMKSLSDGIAEKMRELIYEGDKVWSFQNIREGALADGAYYEPDQEFWFGRVVEKGGTAPKYAKLALKDKNLKKIGATTLREQAEIGRGCMFVVYFFQNKGGSEVWLELEEELDPARLTFDVTTIGAGNELTDILTSVVYETSGGESVNIVDDSGLLFDGHEPQGETYYLVWSPKAGKEIWEQLC